MRVSVCMATFNGNKYVGEQIESILSQLGVLDELIIVDDASTDNTVEIIKRISDQRIILHEGKSNTGPVGAFNRSLSMATGEIVYLSDQDDIWYADKVMMINRLFDDKELDLVVHNARVTSDSGVLSHSLFDMCGSSPGLIRNIISSTHTGCCMAIRRSSLVSLLPVPNWRGVYHDAWIGTLSGCMRYKKIFYPVPLMDYRRHGENVSTMRRRSLADVIPDRVSLLAALILRIVSMVFVRFSRN